MSLYSHKSQGAGAVQPWSQTITLAEAGKGCDGLFSLYDSLGDKTLVGANSVSTMLDGPEKVVRYGALTLGDGTTPTSLTAANRCKGLVILCDSLTVKANATLHMTGRGARVDRADDPFFPFIDFKIPFRISLDSSRMPLAQALAVIKTQGFAPWDIGTFQHVIAGMFGFNCAVSLAGSLALMTASGCGLFCLGTLNQTSGFGNAGSNGGCGGGGGGGSAYYGNNSYGGAGGAGTPYSGGSGGGGIDLNISAHNWGEGAVYSGRGGRGGMLAVGGPISADPFAQLATGTNACGGGAGNPGGVGSSGGGNTGSSGTGGKLVIIARNSIIVQSGGKVEANGTSGGAATYGNGGGSGGGHISIITPAYSNSGTVQCAGGTRGNGTGPGGNGGAGSVVTKTFSDMGW